MALVDHGFDVSTEDNLVLRYAAVRGDLEMVDLCLAHGADPNSRNGEALRRALKAGHESIVLRLIEHGADYADLPKARAIHDSHLIACEVGAQPSDGAVSRSSGAFKREDP